MNKRKAKRLAWWLASRAVRASLDVGWPFAMRDCGRAEFGDMTLEDIDGGFTEDGKRLAAGLEEVVEHMEDRGQR